MSEHSLSPRQRAFIWTLSILSILGIHLAVYFSGALAAPGELLDPDGYTRLVRVEQLHDTGEWFNPVVPRSNPTHPETIQWSRLVDGVLLAGAWMFAPFVGFQSGLFWWGVIFSPLILALSGPLLAWAALPIIRGRGTFFLVLLFYCQPGILIYSTAGRPDHHSALIFLTILTMGWTLRTLDSNEKYRIRHALLAGLAQSLALAVSVETLIPTAITLALFGISWLAGGKRAAACSFSYSVSLLAGSFVFIFLSILPAAWTLKEVDRLSPAYLVPFTVISLFWGLILWIERFAKPPTAGARCLAGAAGVVLCLGISSWLAPSLILGPFSGVDPRVLSLWLDSVLEHQPVASNWRQFPGSVVVWIASGLFALPFLLRETVQGMRNKQPSLLLCYLLTGGVVFAVLTLFKIRWCTYAQLFLVVPLALMVESLILKAESSLPLHKATLARCGILLFFCAGYLPLGWGLGKLLAAPVSTFSTAGAPSITKPIPPRTLCSWLQDTFPQPERILAFLDYGPEILYRTRHEVITTPDHRNYDGILFFYDVMNCPRREDSQALELLRQKSITLLILSGSSGECGFLEQGNAKEDSIYSTILNGNPPPWLHPIPTPAEWQGAWRVYRVDYSAAAGASAGVSPSGAFAATAKM